MQTNNNIVEIITRTNKKRKLIKKNDFLLLMVSGGSDSTALCYIVKEVFKNDFAIMHLNHNLRKEAKHDEEFVKNLADHLGTQCFIYSKNIKEIAENNKQNIEACGHDIRYECANDAIEKISEEYNIDKSKILICSAHNADDRIENFYMRSIVGTGPGGLASINYKNNNIVRPLLDVAKEQLIDYINAYQAAYIDEGGNKWCEDQTNKDTYRFRSYIRHKIIPLAKRQNPKMIEKLCNSMNLIADESEYIEKQVKKVIEKHFIICDKTISISPNFKDEELVLKRRAIYNALLQIFEHGTRIETKSISSIIDASMTSNYTDNIQENYSVHSNKSGIIIQPMKDYRKARNRI